QLVDRLEAVLDERQWAVLRARQLLVRVEAEALVQRRGHLAGRRRPALRGVTQLVRLADDRPPLDPAAADQDRPDTGVVVAGAAARAGLTCGVRPTAPAAPTIVVEGCPGSAGPPTTAVTALSKFGATSLDICWMSVNGREPWMSQVTSSKTVSNMLTVTNRTPRSMSRRASRQLWPKRVRP